MAKEGAVSSAARDDGKTGGGQNRLIRTLRVYHPMVFAAYTVLALYGSNYPEVPIVDFLLLLGVMVVIATAITSAAGLPYGPRFGGIVTTATLVPFFSYGYIAELVLGRRIGFISVQRHSMLVLLIAIPALVGIAIAFRRRSHLGVATKLLNVVTLILMLTALAGIGWQAVSRALAAQEGGLTAEGVDIPKPLDLDPRGRPRDIIYIVPDRYPGAAALEEFFGLDNSEFLGQLEKRGFFVATEAKSNYPRTDLSLASAMNLEYLSDLGVGRQPPRDDVLTKLIHHNRVASSLQQAGYTFVNIGSWWETTREIPQADVNEVMLRQSEFLRAYLRTTPLPPIVEKLRIDSLWFNPRRLEYRRPQFQFEQIASYSTDPRPMFVFAHFLVPHRPFVFNRDGSYVSYEVWSSRPDREHFVEQVLYMNRELKALFDKLLAGPEETHPIILLQADEGPFPREYREDPESYVWREAPQSHLRRKFPILSAYYLPGVEDHGLYDSITPVNSFRRIFDLYFNTDLGLVEDKILSRSGVPLELE